MVDDEVLVVTHPLAPASESHVEALLDIIGAVTSVALVTTNLSDDSDIRARHEVMEIADEGVGESILVAALRFVLNQFRMCRTIHRRDEDVVLFFGATSYLVPILFARLRGRTVVLQPRGNVPLTLRLQWEQRVPSPLARALAGLVWGLERLGYHAAHAIVTYTESMASELSVDSFSSKLYPHGARYIDTDEFRPLRAFENRGRRVGFLGRLDEEKGVRTLAAAAKRLPEDVTFRFIGDGDLRPWLEDELADEIDSGRVEMPGWVDHDDVPEQLSDLRLLVLPSQPTEGLPTVILESLACGTPVLATPVSGVPDVVREGETGFLLDSLSPDELATRCQHILDREDLNTVSEQGRKLILEEFSFEAAVGRYERFLSSLDTA
jgi:glycosyltransferase involved in cell wall biosynthesis